MKHCRSIISGVAAAALAVATLTGCFKKESFDTIYRIAVYSQNVAGEALTRASDLEAYAFYVDTTLWRIASWEDALAHVITDKEDPSRKLSQPDVVGEFDAAADFQVSLPLTAEMSMLVVVDKANSMYAYRKYLSPINIEQILTQLHIYAWKPTYNANGWRIVNPFPDEPRPPLVPVEPEPDNPEPDQPGNPDDPGQTGGDEQTGGGETNNR